MHPLHILKLVKNIINNNKNAFEFILNGLKNDIITKSKQKEIVIFFKDYINELSTPLLQTKSIIKNEFNFCLDILGTFRFFLMELKKVKKYKLIYSVNLAEINFYAWMIVKNLHYYVLKEIINHKENKYTTKKQTKKRM